MNRILLTAALVVSCSFGAACGSDDSIADCADLYAPGKTISTEQAERGCRQQDGTVLDDNTCERVDGVWVVTYEDHDPPLWGLTGKGLRPAPDGLDDDAEYQKAIALC
jgi:hypothetical protein